MQKTKNIYKYPTNGLQRQYLDIQKRKQIKSLEQQYQKLKKHEQQLAEKSLQQQKASEQIYQKGMKTAAEVAQLATVGTIIGKGVTSLSTMTGLSNPIILATLASTATAPYIYKLWKKYKNRKK